MDTHSLPQKQHIMLTEHDSWQTPDISVGSTRFKNTDCKLSQEGRCFSLEICNHNICLPKCYPGICLERMRRSIKIFSSVSHILNYIVMAMHCVFI